MDTDGLMEMTICWQWKDRLITASSKLSEFINEVKLGMEKNIKIPHISTLKIKIGDQTNVREKEYINSILNHGISPFNGKMVVFGTCDERKDDILERQIVFLMSCLGDIFAYEDKFLFYIAPTFSDFWTSILFFSHENAIDILHQDSKYSISQYRAFFNGLKYKGVVITDKLPSQFTGRNRNGKRSLERFTTLAYTKKLISRGTQTDNSSTVLKKFTIYPICKKYGFKNKVCGVKPQEPQEHIIDFFDKIHANKKGILFNGEQIIEDGVHGWTQHFNLTGVKKTIG